MRVDLLHFRPLVRPVFAATGRSPLQLLSTRSFSSSNVRQTMQQRPRVLENLLHKPFRSSSLLFTLKSSSRSFMTDSTAISQPTKAESWKRFGITAVAVAGTVVFAEMFLNRDTRDTLTDAERSYLNDSFKYTGGGLVLTAIAARSLFKAGVAFRIMSANPWAVLGYGLAGSIASMIGVYMTSPENTVQKHLFWLAFNGCQAATLSPLFFLNPAILARAALYTCGVVGSLSYVGATATNDKFLYLGGPLLAGVTVVALSSLAPMALPLGMRGLAITESVSLFGGLAVFSGFVLYDTQKILHNAVLAEQGVIPRDPVRESISLELDMINMFIRILQLLNWKKRKGD